MLVLLDLSESGVDVNKQTEASRTTLDRAFLQQPLARTK